MLDVGAFASRLGLQSGLDLAPDSKPVLETDDDEAVAATFSGVECVVGDAAQSLGPGTLYVTTRRVLWVGSGEPATSIGMQYGQISMHAVSKDPEAHAKPCVYLQLDEGSDYGADDDEEEEEGEDAPPSAEVRFVPDDADAVEDIFKSLCECSALNPDADNEDDGQAELFFDEAEALAGLPADQRASVLAARTQDALHVGQEGEEGEGGEDELLELMADDPDRFEDDEEYEDGDEEGAAPAPGNGYAH